MKIFWILLLAFWLLVIIFPEFLAYLVGGAFTFMGVSLILTDYQISKMQKNSDSYVKFGNYKIYR